MTSPMLFAEMDATGWVVIITAAISGISVTVLQVVSMILAYRREADKLERDKVVEAKVELVKTTLADATTATATKLDAIADVSQKTHDLSNSATLEIKRVLATTSRALYVRSHDPDHLAAAEAAEAAYQRHKAKQDAIDKEEHARSTGRGL